MLSTKPSAATFSMLSNKPSTATFFYHVPTTGGRSLVGAMKTLGVAYVQMGNVQDVKDSAFDAVLRAACKSNRSDVFVDGHYSLESNLAARLCPTRKVRNVVLLREPISRAISWIEHQMQTSKSWPSSADSDDKSVLINIENRFTFQLGGAAHVYPRPSDATRQYAAAQSLIKRSHVLFTPDLDEAIRLLFQRCDKKNGTVPHVKSPPKRKVTPAMRERIVALNKLDIALYKWALQHHNTTLSSRMFRPGCGKASPPSTASRIAGWLSG